MWTLRCYDLGHDGGFRGWCDSQDPEIQAEIDTALEILVAQSALVDSATYEELRGKCAGLSEVKVDVGADKFRLLGFEGPGRREFTLLLGFCKETNADYGRQCPKALKRKEGVLKDARRAPICSFP